MLHAGYDELCGRALPPAPRRVPCRGRRHSCLPRQRYGQRRHRPNSVRCVMLLLLLRCTCLPDAAASSSLRLQWTVASALPCRGCSGYNPHGLGMLYNTGDCYVALCTRGCTTARRGSTTAPHPCAPKTALLESRSLSQTGTSPMACQGVCTWGGVLRGVQWLLAPPRARLTTGKEGLPPSCGHYWPVAHCQW